MRAMASLTLTYNTGGGDIDIVLTIITAYSITNIRKYATKQVPGKVTPTVDTDVFVFMPKKYNIRAVIDASEKAALQTLANNADYQVVFDDSEVVGTVNCRVANIGFNMVIGNTEYPWIANIELTGEDH